VLKFVIIMRHSSASWARMLKVPEDRASEVAHLMEYFHGSLEAIYWEVETGSAFVIANLPDSVAERRAARVAGYRPPAIRGELHPRLWPRQSRARQSPRQFIGEQRA